MTRTLHQVGILTALVALALALAGCGVAAGASPTTPVDEADAGVVDVSDPCDVAAHSDGGLVVDDVLHVEKLSIMHDLGERPGAMGTVTANSDGSLASYTAAAGDWPEAVAGRLCASTAWLYPLNAVRRDDLTHSMRLHPGDVLNLDPATITTVGTEEGRSYDHATDFSLPPQR